MIGGQTGHAQVDHLSPHPSLDAPVLRNALFRDGHVGLDFQAADDGGLQPFGRAFHLVEHAVNPVADPKSFGERFEMNVRRPRAKGLHDDGVDQFDDRRVRIHGRPVVHGAAGRRQTNLHLSFGDVLDHLAHRIVRRPVVLVQRGFDVFFGGDADADFRLQQMVQAVDGVEVGRIAERDGEAVAVLEHRHNPVTLRDMFHSA